MCAGKNARESAFEKSSWESETWAGRIGQIRTHALGGGVQFAPPTLTQDLVGFGDGRAKGKHPVRLLASYIAGFGGQDPLPGVADA